LPDKLLLNLDIGPLGALARVALGAAFAVVFGAWRPGARPGTAAAALAAVLFGLKAATAVARRLVPAPPLVRAHMEWRRNLARLHDSYQWRKLLWLGLGMVAAAAALGRTDGWELPLGAACVLGGVAAEVVWRRKRLPLSPPTARAGIPG
jgi:hypothetical protein